MRAIKFRGKCVPDSKYAGEWVTGGYVAPEADAKKQDEGLIISYFGGNNTFICHVIPETVGQFTGLCDKNGTEVYEGDIVKYTNGTKKVNGAWVDNSRIFAVEYDEGSFDVASLFHVSNCLEVIGNIHDTPELLDNK